MQEKLEAQQRDMAILKNDVVRLRRDLSAERDLVTSLRSHAADASWAIADVKRGQDQVMALCVLWETPLYIRVHNTRLTIYANKTYKKPSCR